MSLFEKKNKKNDFHCSVLCQAPIHASNFLFLQNIFCTFYCTTQLYPDLLTVPITQLLILSLSLNIERKKRKEISK